MESAVPTHLRTGQPKTFCGEEKLPGWHGLPAVSFEINHLLLILMGGTNTKS